jgi:metal-responsive CopG/Arc/MetJ family transcriptional regulator
VLIVLHSHATEKKLSDAKHAFLSLVQSQNHFHSQDHSCIDQFFLSGDAGKIKKMRDRLLAQKEIKKTVLVFL